MATLKKMTRVGADVRQIARLLQAKAPENHMLAYITPEEAQFLKDRGGSGMPDPETGVPTFAPAYDYGFTEDTAYDFGPEPTQAFLTPVQTSSASGVDLTPMGDFSGGASSGYYDLANNRPSAYGQPVAFSTLDQVGQQETAPTYFTGASPAAYAKYPVDFGGVPVDIRDVPAQPFDTTPSRTIGERYSDLAKSLGVKEDTLARLGLAGLQVGLGARQARMAKEESQKAKEEQQKLAAPYRQQGAELQRQAQAGELTPVGQQQLRTVQAQAAQAASSRGGVGAQQTAARIENLRNQLLQQQSDYGLKLSGIGDQILLGSIRTGLEADRYVNQLATTYYTNIARTLAGAPTVVQYGVTQ
jgi:hypothetical protein